MRVVVQRCSRAEVRIEGAVVGKIDKGFLLLVGITDSDAQHEADVLVRKIAQLRVFEDQAGKMNLSIGEVGGAILSISQFTLFADCRKGNRPSFIRAARPDKAAPLYDYFNEALQQYGLHVETGRFGADMKVDFVNDGPVTILLDTDELITSLEGKENIGTSQDSEPHCPARLRGSANATPKHPKQTAPAVDATTDKEDARVMRLLRVIGMQKLPRKQVMADLGLKQNSRKSFVENYLRPAWAKGYICFEYPFSPNAPLQAYCLTKLGRKRYTSLSMKDNISLA